MNFNFNCNVTNQEKYYGNYVIPDQIERKVCIDLGCNVGFFVMDNFKNFDNLYAIDASYQNFVVTLRKVLHENLKNNTANNVACFNLACSKNNGQIIKIYKHDFNGNSVSPMTVTDMFKKQYPQWQENQETYHNVFTISLEGLYQFFNIEYIDYLKIDIEGAEYDFLLEKDLSKIGCLAIELHGTLGLEMKNKMKKHIEKYFNIYHVEYDETPGHSVITYLNKSFEL